MAALRYIFWDQLNEKISSLEGAKKGDHLLFAETIHDCTFIRHHPKKLIFLLSSMRKFARNLEKKGFIVHYIYLNDHCASFIEAIETLFCQNAFSELIVTEPSNYDDLQKLQKLSLPIRIKEDTRFFCSKKQFFDWTEGKKSFLLETFYRMMRKKSGLLLDENGSPLGGSWNYDQENRKRWPGAPKPIWPKAFNPDEITNEVLSLVEKNFSRHFGTVEGFSFATSREQALEALEHFIAFSLPLFGDYQDAMSDQEPFLFHSHLSPYLNNGLLLPKEVCKAAVQAYAQKKAPLNAVEAFIRQILGWREYVRGVYWLLMPDYLEQNFFHAKRELPPLYWGKKSGMHCMDTVVENTRKHALSHHIQRLMVTGNFALLAGIDPKQVCKWYLEVYADAFEWVEHPNTHSMALYADGGILASKPYAASGNYIHRMSNFCKSCSYNPKLRTGDTACPFNFLYWDFLSRNKNTLASNPRLKFAYNNLEKISFAEKKKIEEQSFLFLEKICQV